MHVHCNIHCSHPNFCVLFTPFLKGVDVCLRATSCRCFTNCNLYLWMVISLWFLYHISHIYFYIQDICTLCFPIWKLTCKWFEITLVRQNVWWTVIMISGWVWEILCQRKGIQGWGVSHCPYPYVYIHEKV